MSQSSVPSNGVIFSSVLIGIGLFLLFIFPAVLQFFAYKEFKLSPSSESFKHWRRTPVPVSFDFYLFNWTNPSGFGKEKPAFTELGPYRFYETREKVNLTWNDNGTLTYRQARLWLFKASESSGSLQDLVTTVNGVSLTAAHRMRHMGYFQQQSLNMLFGFTEQRVWVTHTVADLLFDGYNDNLVTLSNSLSSLTPNASPFDKFGWFYMKNHSYTYDGWFNIDTGARDISRLGTMLRWNHQDHTGFFPGSCGQVNGFTGDMFPPSLATRQSSVHLFNTDLCRSLRFDYSKDSEVLGIQGYQFTPVLNEPDAPQEDPEHSCFCNGECVPGGLLNLTSCRYGAPIFVSLPHFLDVNPLYLNKVQGLQPDRHKHEFYITIEPTYGSPIDVKARVQLNMMMQPIPHITMYKRAPRMMFPVLWVDQRAAISEPLAEDLRLVLLLPSIASKVGVTLLPLGVILLVVLVVRRSSRIRLPGETTNDKSMGVITTTELPSILLTPKKL